MAALSPTMRDTRLPLGNRFVATGSVAVTAAGPGHVPKESLKLSEITGVAVTNRSAKATVNIRAVPNAQSTTADANPGDLYLDVEADATVDFIVIGRP